MTDPEPTGEESAAPTEDADLLPTDDEILSSLIPKWPPYV